MHEKLALVVFFDKIFKLKLECYPPERLKREIREITASCLDLKVWHIFFFGSRVRGDNFPRADIDIGIEGPTELPAGVKLELEEKLEKLPTLYKFDLVDFQKVSDDFRKEALQNTEAI